MVFPASQPAKQVAKRDPIYRGVDLRRVVAWTEASAAYNNPRGFHPALWRGGWKGFIASVVQPEVDWLRVHSVERPRVLIHNPYGVERDSTGKVGEFRFSQRALCAGNSRTKHLADGLGAAIRPLVDSGAEVIVYFGSLPNDPAEQLLREPGGREKFFQMCDEQVADAIAGGASIAFDASNDLPADSPQWEFIERTAAKTKVYLEPRPQARRPQMFGYPIVTQDAFWDRSNPEKYPDSRWGARNDQLTGEIIRFVQFPDPPAVGRDPGWNDTLENLASRLIPPAQRIQADGHTATLATSILRQSDR